MAGTAALIRDELPEDLRLVSLTSCAAAWNVCERKARRIIDEAGVSMVELGARSGGIRLSDARQILARRERTKGAS